MNTFILHEGTRDHRDYITDLGYEFSRVGYTNLKRRHFPIKYQITFNFLSAL